MGGTAGLAGAPQATTRDRLAADVTRFRELLNGHLAHEETDALPLDQRSLVFADSGLIIRITLALTGRRFAREHRTAFRWL